MPNEREPITPDQLIAKWNYLNTLIEPDVVLRLTEETRSTLRLFNGQVLEAIAQRVIPDNPTGIELTMGLTTIAMIAQVTAASAITVAKAAAEFLEDSPEHDPFLLSLGQKELTKINKRNMQFAIADVITDDHTVNDTSLFFLLANVPQLKTSLLGMVNPQTDAQKRVRQYLISDRGNLGMQLEATIRRRLLPANPSGGARR